MFGNKRSSESSGSIATNIVNWSSIIIISALFCSFFGQNTTSNKDVYSLAINAASVGFGVVGGYLTAVQVQKKEEKQ